LLKEKLKEIRNKVVDDATNNKSIYAPQKQWVLDHFGKELLQGMIKLNVDEKNYAASALKQDKENEEVPDDLP